MSGPTDADARLVLRQFGLPAAPAEPLGNRGGFSGARLWRVRTARGDFCLKAWPPGGMTPDRHAEIARLTRHARDVGLHFVPLFVPTPDGHSCIDLAGRLWDLAEWMPGVADYRADPSPARLRAACTALARLHRAWEQFAAWQQSCPAVTRRLVAAGEWIDATCGVPGLSAFAPVDPVSPWAERASHIVGSCISDVRRVLQIWRAVPLSVQPCLCDVWHDHVLFTGDDVTGLIDYGAVKVDNVAADLARLLGSLVGDDPGRYEIGLDAYATVRPLTGDERRLVPILDRTGVILGLANWLRWLYRDERSYEDRAAVAARIAELVLRAESWASVGA